MSDAHEQNEQMKAIAAAYNAQNPTGDSDEENAARIAAAELAKAQGSKTHSGEHEVRADTEEELAAAEAAKAKAAEEAGKGEGDEEGEEASEETPAEVTPAGEDVTEWVQSDSPEFNAAIGLMKAAGMTPAEGAAIFDDAANTGDLSKVDRAALVEKVGEDQAALIMAGFTKFVDTTGAALLERVNAVHDSVGGSDNWSKITGWARTKAKGDEAFKAEIQELTELMNGKSISAAKLAGKELLAKFNADKSNSTLTTTTAPSVTPSGKPAAPSAPAVKPISAREYAEAVEDAQRNLRGSDQTARLAELSKQRAAGRNKGI